MITDQYLRKVSLLVTSADTAVEFGSFRIKFRVSQSDIETPNTATIRIYNLSEATERQLSESKEFTRVILQAGYKEGNFGTIFDGTIKQFRRGRENPTDTYFDILAADADIPYNFGIVNSTLAAGSTMQDRVEASAQAAGVVIGSVPDFGANQLPRGKVLFGMARDVFRNAANTSLTSWSLQNGKLVMIPITSYLPGEAVVLTSKTGMVGMPEQTNDGIKIKSLLNPKLLIGTRVQINNADVQRALFSTQFTAINIPPSIAADGFYKVLVVEHVGDTRGQEWYSDMVCLVVNSSAPPATSVNPYGAN